MKTFPMAAALAVLALVAPESSAPARKMPPPKAAPKIEFEMYVLDNGLEVILHRDPSVPLVAVDVWYHVGSGDETLGKSGFAHLFEHMLFQGSKHVGEDRHFEILKNIGASGVNGSTTTDRTNYYEVVPSHQLETALWLESDRMGYLLPLLSQKSLDNQIEVVRNERRQNYDNQPYGKAVFALAAALYPEGHPYRYTTIGKHEDLASSSLGDVTGFFTTWYTPANATLVIAGDFETADAKALVAKWFGSFPRTTKPTRGAATVPSIQRSRTEVADEFAKLRRIEYAWHTPKQFAPGDAELDVLASALGDTGTGRLYKILVHDKQLAQSVSAGQASRELSSYFTVQVLAKSDADLAAVDKIVGEEIARLQSEMVSPQELNRAVVQIEAGFIWGLESLLARAENLQRCNHYLGKPDCIADDLARYRAVTPESVREVAKKYLGSDRRAEILTVPAAAEGGK